jgi:hypothetical protein
MVGWDAIISTVGMPLIKTQLPMIDAAVVAGVKRFVPSEFGFDPTIPSNAGEKVYTMKTAVSDKLKDASKANANFTYTLLSTGKLNNTFCPPDHVSCAFRWLCVISIHGPRSIRPGF